VGREVVGDDLNFDFGPLCKVEVPLGVTGRSAARPHDKIPVAIESIDQRRGDRLSRTPTGRREQQSGHVVPDVTVFALGLEIAIDVVLYPSWTCVRHASLLCV
jgi:hypothetical protein